MHEDFNGSTLETVDIALIDIPGYQRRLHQDWVDEIADDWNPRLFRRPILSAQPNGRYNCVDGHHEIAAATRRGHTSLPCEVIHGLTYAQEARLFADLQQRRHRLTPIEVYQSALLGGDRWAVELQRVTAVHGLTVGRDSDHYVLGCINRAKGIILSQGPQRLDDALTVLCGAFPGEGAENRFRLSGQLIIGMADLIRRTRARGTYDPDVFIRRLREASFEMGEITNIGVNPTTMRAYIATLVTKGRIGSNQTSGQGDATLYGKAFASIIHGWNGAKRLYPRTNE